MDVTYREGLDRQGILSFLHVFLIGIEIRLYGITKTGLDCHKNHCLKGKGVKTPNKKKCRSTCYGMSQNNHEKQNEPTLIFSSPELKAQVSFPDHLSFIVCLSVNFSHFLPLLQNHWTNFNQNWHKVSPSDGDSSLFK